MAKKKMASKARGKKTAARGGSKRGGAGGVSLVVGSKVKEFIKSQGCKNSSEVLDAANASLAATLQRACARASANKRSTVRGQDF